MGQKLFQLFKDKQDFIIKADKTTSIVYEYPTDRIIKIVGSLKWMGISEDIHEKVSMGIQLGEIIPETAYNKIAFLIRTFFGIKQRNFKHHYFFTFVASSLLFGNNIKEFRLVNIYMYLIQKKAEIVFCDISSAGRINEKLFLGIESGNKKENKIVFAANIIAPPGFYLLNFEFDILQLLSKGLTSDEISELLRLSKYTVDEYRKGLLEKFLASNPYQLIKNAQQEGFI